MTINIKLNDRPLNAPVNVDVQWNVEVTEQKSGFLAKLFRGYNKVERSLKLGVSNIVVPEEIVCDQNKLFSILYNGNITPQSAFPVDVSLDSMAVPFQLLFHQEEIKDCTKSQDANHRKYTINFDVKLSDEEGKEIKSVSEQIDLIFEPLGVKPQLKFDLEQEEIQYPILVKTTSKQRKRSQTKER